jgi:glycosyl transferase family 2
MTNWPDVVIGVITYNRPAEIRKNLLALLTHVHYSGAVTVMIADDCSPGTYLPDLAQWWLDNQIPWRLHLIPRVKNGGWGTNTNGLIQQAALESSYLLMLEDDYIVMQDLNLDVGVALLACEKRLGMLRYRGTVGTPMRYLGCETDISAYIPDYREYVGYGIGKVNWLELDPASSTLWIYSNGPHLKRIDFHQQYGLYPEGLKLGQTEEVYAHMVQDRQIADSSALRIGILPDWIHLKWDHIGRSYQLSELDKERTLL